MGTLERQPGSGEHWWQSVADAWHNLRVRAEKAVTRFAPQSQPESDHPFSGEWTWAVLAADVREEDERIIVQLEIPGMDEDDFKIDVVGRNLHISGVKQREVSQQRGNYQVVERAYGRFERVLPLSADVFESDARATYKKGVLTVTLPKRQTSAKRVIPVKSG